MNQKWSLLLLWIKNGYEIEHLHLITIMSLLLSWMWEYALYGSNHHQRYGKKCETINIVVGHPGDQCRWAFAHDYPWKTWFSRDDHENDEDDRIDMTDCVPVFLYCGALY